jgi:hypothetical protein
MNCVILADSPVKGIKSKGWIGSLPVNSKYNLIDHQVNVLEKSFPKCKIIYVYGFDNKKVENYLRKMHREITFVKNLEYSQYGQAFSIYQTIDLIEKECLFFYGDLVIQPSMFKSFNRKNSQIFINKQKKSELGSSTDSQNNVEHINYGLDNPVMNMFFINDKNMYNFKEIIQNWNYRNYFYFEIINRMIDQGAQFSPTEFNRSNLFLTINEQQERTICL